MRLVTVSFNYPPKLKRMNYRRLLEVFEASIRRHMPGCEICSLRIDPPDHSGAKKLAFLSNTSKLQIWAAEMKRAAYDGENVIFADCDMICTKDVSPVFDMDFDVAYTVRDDHTNIPLNGGIVFAKPTKAALRFFTKWAEVDARMYEDWNFHCPWRIKYAGMNQASFGYVREHMEEAPGVTLLELPTTIYNAVNTDWHLISSDTVFIHIKSQLRKAVLTGAAPSGTMAPAMQLWYEAAGMDMRQFAR